MGIQAIIGQVKSDLRMLPEKTAGATGAMDKTLKLTNSIIDNAIYFSVIRGSFAGGAAILKGRFKDLTDLLSLPNVLTQVKDMLRGSFWVANRVKNVSKVLLTLGQAFDFVRLLDAFKLVSLKSITSAIGKIPVVGSSIPLFLPVAIIKDSFFFGSTLTSVWQTSQDIGAVSIRTAKCQDKAAYWKRIQQDFKGDAAKAAIKGLCALKFSINTLRSSIGAGKTSQDYVETKTFWENAVKSLKDKKKFQFEQLCESKIEKWQSRLENNQKEQTKNWIALAADVSKVAVIALGLSMGVFGVNPSTVVSAGFTFGSIFNPVALTANAMGVYKPMHDANIVRKEVKSSTTGRTVSLT